MHEPPTFVFGFGSLAGAPASLPSRRPHPGGYVADLAGYRRTWDVAMDNRATIPGYKYYLDPVTGERPPVFVTFVNLRPAAGERVNGWCFPVTAQQLELLDRRERNYRRVDVSDAVEPAAGARVFAYLGLEAAQRRYEQGAARGAAVVHAAYHRLLRQAFERLGEGEDERFRASTDAPACRIRELQLVPVPLTG